jgi:predicted helicase
VPGKSGEDQRDAWVYNFSATKLEINSKQTIDYFNSQAKAYNDARISNPNLTVEEFIDNDQKKISWSRALRNDNKNKI